MKPPLGSGTDDVEQLGLLIVCGLRRMIDDDIPVRYELSQQTKRNHRIVFLALDTVAGVHDDTGRMAKQATKAFYISWDQVVRT